MINKIGLYYQPICTLEGEECFFEALLRIDGEGEAPLTFKDVVSDLHSDDQLADIDELIMSKAVVIASKLDKKQKLFVNLSNVSLTNTRMNRLFSIVTQAGCAEKLVLEFDCQGEPIEPKKLSVLTQLVHNHKLAISVQESSRDDYFKYQGMGIDFFKINSVPSIVSITAKMREAVPQSKIIAQKLESPAELVHAFNAGVDYVQGYAVIAPVGDIFLNESQSTQENKTYF